MSPPLNPAKTLGGGPIPRTLFSSLLQPTFKSPSSIFLSNGRIPHALRIASKLNTSQDSKSRAPPDDNNSKKKKKRIVVFGSAPPVSEEGNGVAGNGEGKRAPAGVPLWGFFKRMPKKVLAALSNLPLAIGEMFAIAALMALGTVIDQGEAPDHYFQKYPEENPVFGFVTWRWVLGLGFDHMFTSPVFLCMLILLAASLMACTYTTQIPLVKVARRWSFMNSTEAIRKQEFAESLPRASIQDLGIILMGAGYEVSQFFTDISLFSLDGKEVMRKTIRVNDPLRYGGLTIYQTDWGFSALQISKNGEGPFNLAMAPLQTNGDKKLFGTFLPIGNTDSPNVKGISMLARDLQSIVLYDQEGKFAGVRRPSSKLPIEIDGMKIVIEDAIGSTGLDLKTDPGVPIVYAGFGALMLTTSISFLSHSQVWALQDGTTVVFGGKTNRGKIEFQEEMNCLLDKVPEIIVVDDTLNG
uniref:Cytochrome c biogenesis protein CCS1, chloroplastic isoform X2 n=1 Tax=Elaeis guineensis var. tenera TaxID=51953 RepID=A0A6I9SED2_ELAGV|nr:cytochrome c biogenesis protein CCS1, chloroplastic isoform X2 [Elaeis guineensis]